MSEWIKCSERLPDPLKPVLLRQRIGLQGNAVTVIGKWVPARTEESVFCDEDWVDYDEVADAYYVPEGWYESQINWGEYDSIYISDEVTHWQPLPEPPK